MISGLSMHEFVFCIFCMSSILFNEILYLAKTVQALLKVSMKQYELHYLYLEALFAMGKTTVAKCLGAFTKEASFIGTSFLLLEKKEEKKAKRAFDYTGLGGKIPYSLFTTFGKRFFSQQLRFFVAQSYFAALKIFECDANNCFPRSSQNI